MRDRTSETWIKASLHDLNALERVGEMTAPSANCMIRQQELDIYMVPTTTGLRSYKVC